MNKSVKIFSLSALVALTGCATKHDHYYWGHYESLVYDMYIEPGSADATTQISKLETDLQKAEAEGKPVPPGVHAHLGYMYATAGKVDQAVSEFTTEKSLYPESAVLIDGMMSRSKGVEK